MTQPNRRDFLQHAAKSIAVATVAATAVSALAAEPLAPPDKQPPNLPTPKPPHKKVGFAVIGLGELALEQILPAFALCDNCAPVALVSGHRDKAEKVAAHYGIDPKNIYDYQNYDTLSDNPAVDVIYIVLPNSMHAEYTVRGFKAGKHVLCEKPMATSVDECNQMIDAGKAAGKQLMIAYRLHFEPYNKKAIEIARSKQFGPLTTFTSENLQDTKAPNIRLSKTTGGGPLGDVGVYCLNAARYITGEEPIEVSGMSYANPKDDRFREVPQTVAFSLRFASGVLAQCVCGFGSGRSNRFRAVGTKGYLELSPAFNYIGQRLTTSDGQTETQHMLPHVDHFQAEMDHFADCVTTGAPNATPGEEGLADMKLIKLIEQSIADGGKGIKVG